MPIPDSRSLLRCGILIDFTSSITKLLNQIVRLDILQSNRMFSCGPHCNIAMQCCNIDQQVAWNKLQSL